MALHWQCLKQTDPTAAKQLAQKIGAMEGGVALAVGAPPAGL
jgi:hypothetical protein